MKKIIFILALACLCNRLPAANYYVSTTGNDSPANGSAGNPWRTIRYACQQVAANAGHVINVAAGSYAETDTINIPSGVSVIGAGQASTNVTVNKYFNILNYGTTCSGAPDTSYDPYNEQFVIQMNGSNQTIKGFTLDGQSKACHGGIYALNANYCVFEDLKIQYFRFSGLWVENSINTEIRNSHFRNNTFANKACDTGNIQFHYNTNLLIHDNYIQEDGAIGGIKGGYGIKAYSGTYTNFCWWQWWTWNWSHYADGMKIYNNTIIVPELGGWETGAGAGVPAISIEINGLSSRNVEIYNNYINNHISLIGGYNNETEPMVRVHNNYFDLGARYAYAVEANVINLEIDHNYINGGLYPIAQWEGGRTGFKNHSIHHNIFYDQWNGQALTRYEIGVDGFKFYHNTVVDSKGISTVFDVAGGNHVNSDVRNNIFTSTYGARGGLYNAGETAGTIAYNLFNNINAVGTNFITASPLLVWSGNKPAPFFGLQAGSPARNAGVYIAGINNGYNESAPDMGAYEYGIAPFPVGTVAAGTPTFTPTITRTPTRTSTATPRPTVACNAPYNIEAESFDSMTGITNKGTVIGDCDP
ncbi:MAG TPA: hypothetical protein ENN43_06085, partial [bacterium]|nr:hypothetical protein [bacterium]